jgi:hypothetical protein
MRHVIGDIISHLTRRFNASEACAFYKHVIITTEVLCSTDSKRVVGAGNRQRFDKAF